MTLNSNKQKALNEIKINNRNLFSSMHAKIACVRGKWAYKRREAISL